jgi:hypothetical protein
LGRGKGRGCGGNLGVLFELVAFFLLVSSVFP